MSQSALQGKLKWQDVLTSRLTDDIKLVGPTISCEGSPKGGDKDGEWRTNPHVQSYVVATDKVCAIAAALVCSARKLNQAFATESRHADG